MSDDVHDGPDEVALDSSHEELLRRLAVLDRATIDAALPAHVAGEATCTLEPRVAALVRLTGLVALQSSPQSYEWGVAAALAAGATEGDLVGVLTVLAPVIGAARTSRAAADIAMAFGFDVELRGRS
jgi:alkylhydroperoxidase/carboxymuconolactone decarboxylase family protein YurZ